MFAFSTSRSTKSDGKRHARSLSSPGKNASVLARLTDERALKSSRTISDSLNTILFLFFLLFSLAHF